MGKLIVWVIFGIIIAALAGIFPHVAVGVTAISIVFLFLFAKFLGE